jgi:transcriptional regulator with GAF, ATPase, and Fis domain
VSTVAARRNRGAEPPDRIAASLGLTKTDSNRTRGAAGQAEGGPAAYVVVEQGDLRRLIALDPGAEVSIGRSEQSTVCTQDPRASRTHARIFWQDGTLTIEDLGSHNGTWINDRTLRAERCNLAGADVVTVADLRIVIALAAARVAGSERETEPGIVIADPKMQEVSAVVSRLARTQTTVLIFGETGVGKEIFGEHIHRLSTRAHRPFIRLDCASLPESMLESQLFGHEKGAFTGAHEQRVGYFEAADGGTLLLDEIGEMPASSQVKLLRVLESRTISRLGSTKEIAIDVRILCATNRDLLAEVEAGRFRRDLYYRISTFKLRIPPLRERPVEIGLLAELFVDVFARKTSVAGSRFNAAASAALLRYAWPGNVRELRNAIEHAVVLAQGAEIGVEHLPQEVTAARQGEASPVPRSSSALPEKLESKLSEVERMSILDALLKENGNQSRAAKRLGITRRALIYRMGKLGL